MIDETRVQQVREAIYRAFGNLPVPPCEALIPQSPECDSASRADFRKALSGRTWQNLEPEVLTQRWAAYCYLSPKAYRYYLPALLAHGLPEAGEPTDFTFTVLFGLGPCFSTLFHDGRNAHWRRWRKWYQARQAAFTDEQYRAVCGFLGLFIADNESGYQHFAAQALYWRWNRLDTSAHRAAQAYYHRLHHFTYSEPKDPQVAALYTEIRSAFADTPYPGDDQLASGGDDDSSEIGVEFRGLRWHSVHPQLLSYQYTARSFLSDNGLRYFLPAFLLADLHYYDSDGASLYESDVEPVEILTQGLASDPVQRPRRRSVRSWKTCSRRNIQRLPTPRSPGERVLWSALQPTLGLSA